VDDQHLFFFFSTPRPSVAVDPAHRGASTLKQAFPAFITYIRCGFICEPAARWTRNVAGQRNSAEKTGSPPTRQGSGSVSSPTFRFEPKTLPIPRWTAVEDNGKGMAEMWKAPPTASPAFISAHSRDGGPRPPRGRSSWGGGTEVGLANPELNPRRLRCDNARRGRHGGANELGVTDWFAITMKYDQGGPTAGPSKKSAPRRWGLLPSTYTGRQHRMMPDPQRQPGR